MIGKQEFTVACFALLCLFAQSLRGQGEQGSVCAICNVTPSAPVFDDNCSTVAVTYFSATHGNCIFTDPEAALCQANVVCRIDVDVTIVDKGCTPPPSYWVRYCEGQNGSAPACQDVSVTAPLGVSEFRGIAIQCGHFQQLQIGRDLAGGSNPAPVTTLAASCGTCPGAPQHTGH